MQDNGFLTKKFSSRVSVAHEYDGDALWDYEGWLNLGPDTRRYISAFSRHKAWRILKVSSTLYLTQCELPLLHSVLRCVYMCVCVCGRTDRINLSQNSETLSSGKSSRCVFYWDAICNSLTQRKLYIFKSNVLQEHYILRSNQDYHQVCHNIKILTQGRYLPNMYQEKGPIFLNVVVYKISIQ